MTGTDIFVVDDERVIAQTLGIILRQAGYKVEVFEDPHAALLAMGGAPRLLLTDNNMPLLSGCSLASLFALAHPGISILVFSGALVSYDLEWRMLERQARSSRLLQKPLHPADMISAVQRMIGHSAVSQKPASALTSNAFPFEWDELLERVMPHDPITSMIVA